MNNNLEVALTKCFFCQEDSDIIMNTKLTPKYAKAVKEMHGKVVGMNPCSKCTEYMKQGIILISIRDGEEKELNKSITPNPYRTGGWIVVKEEYIKRVVTDKKLADWILKWRFSFIPDQVWDTLGLPREKEE
jgi:hypothetical protein